MIVGLGALAWLIFRTGAKPTRFGYPCQQSAFAAAAAAFGAPAVAALVAGRTALARMAGETVVIPGAGKSSRGVHWVLVGFLVVATLAVFGRGTRWGWGGPSIGSGVRSDAASLLEPPSDHHPDIYFVRSARGNLKDSFGGVDDLISLMGVSGLKLHRTAYASVTSAPEGLIAHDDVVLIKVNAQWPQTGGTNTDVLRGLMRNIVVHPDGFAGEIVVADNGQGYGDLDRPQNNAENHDQSFRDVVDQFVMQGFSASTYLWDDIRTTRVQEFDEGDSRDGYVVQPDRDPETDITVSYPKFTTRYETRISYKHGIWRAEDSTYEPDRLVVINLPVLKTHSIYGVTAAVKNHMGVVTTAFNTDSHSGVARGGLGSLMSEVRMPDLNILDCIWVLARPGSGPSATYSQSSFVNQLAASADPMALDVWTVKRILMPQIISNGYLPDSYEQQDPDNSSGKFRWYLDRSMNELLLAGLPCTSEPAAVSLHTWTGDGDRDGDLDLADFLDLPACLGSSGGPAQPCQALDFDLDDAVTLRDVAHFQNVFTGSF